MITIPSNTNTGIRILARTSKAAPKHKRTEEISPIGVSIPQAAKTANCSTIVLLLVDSSAKPERNTRGVDFIVGKRKIKTNTQAHYSQFYENR